MAPRNVSVIRGSVLPQNGSRALMPTQLVLSTAVALTTLLGRKSTVVVLLVVSRVPVIRPTAMKPAKDRVSGAALCIACIVLVTRLRSDGRARGDTCAPGDLLSTTTVFHDGSD